MRENPNASRTWASFRIWGMERAPDEVSTCLNIIPSELHRIGDPHGKNKTWKHNSWHLTSEDQISSANLEVHISWLLDQLEPARAELLALLAEPNVQADIFCYW